MTAGDIEAVASSFVAELGIGRVYAGKRPADKASNVREL